MTFENLEVWQLSSQLSAELYKASREIRDFGFRDQLTRSGLSIPSNIAEGHERGSHREAIYFLNVAKGSCGELRTQIYIGMSVGYIDHVQGNQWVETTRSLSNMLGSLIRTRKSFLRQK